MTLKDFKAAIDREGNHRYHFKALDPEFGTVKEEVQNPGASGWYSSPQKFLSSLTRSEEFPRASNQFHYSRLTRSGSGPRRG